MPVTFRQGRSEVLVGELSQDAAGDHHLPESRRSQHLAVVLRHQVVKLLPGSDRSVSSQPRWDRTGK
ncbi:hypothetical protein [Shimazuella alba]|uniref:Uncharacterized protein n=1 Tax=Shimazuella alba TaxID=2690964 RepID=A0A6I4VU26_9BACL|nr:hypothetical protein [Shimazuella alba]MXQ54018.1 hypothetical protein [Shimazuella alba]